MQYISNEYVNRKIPIQYKVEKHVKENTCLVSQSNEWKRTKCKWFVLSPGGRQRGQLVSSTGSLWQFHSAGWPRCHVPWMNGKHNIFFYLGNSTIHKLLFHRKFIKYQLHGQHKWKINCLKGIIPTLQKLKTRAGRDSCCYKLLGWLQHNCFIWNTVRLC